MIAVLFIQYSASFGIELAVNNIMNLYLLYNFKIEGCVEGAGTMSSSVNSTLMNTTSMTSNVSTTMAPVTTTANHDNDFECSILNQNTASLISSLFGMMNLFGRSLGGITSDVFRRHFDVPGRLLVQLICLTMVGVLMIIFSRITTIAGAVIGLVFFSVFVQMSEGSTYAIVPYVWPRRVGVVAGIVGSGGNCGAIVFNTIWRGMVDDEPSRWFWYLGIFVLCCSSLTLTMVVHSETIFHIFSAREKKNLARGLKASLKASMVISNVHIENDLGKEQMKNGLDNPAFSKM